MPQFNAGGRGLKDGHHFHSTPMLHPFHSGTPFLSVVLHCGLCVVKEVGVSWNFFCQLG